MKKKKIERNIARGAKECRSCRSRKNSEKKKPTLGIEAVDTAETDAPKVSQLDSRVRPNIVLSSIYAARSE